MKFFRSKGFKYAINLAFGLGAAIVMIGALAKLTHQEVFGIGGDIWITIGLGTEALLFAIQGIIPPAPEYYWEKLYPGLDGTGDVEGVSSLSPISGGAVQQGTGITAQLDEVLEDANVNRLSIERLGNNLALLSENIEKMNEVADMGAANSKFVEKANSATNALNEVEGEMVSLKQSVAALNNKYNEMLAAMKN